MIPDKKYVNIISHPAAQPQESSIKALQIMPKTEEQTIVASGDVKGFSPVIVSAVTSSIDSNIVASNIKKDVTILGITGTYESITPKYYGIPAANWAMQETTEPGTPNFAGLTTIYKGFCDNRFSDAENLIGAANFDTVTRIFSEGLSGSFSRTNLTSVSFENLSSIQSWGLAFAFGECSNLTGEVSFPSLTEIQANSQSCFEGAFNNTDIRSADFSELTTIAAPGAFGGCFQGAPLESINFNSLQTITGDNVFDWAFAENTNLESASFPSLTTITGEWAFVSAFSGCTSLRTLEFPALTTVASEEKNIFSDMLYDVEGCTVHFPAALQATIGNWAVVINGFGGTNTTVLFDL